MTNIAIENGKPGLGWGRLLGKLLRVIFDKSAVEHQVKQASTEVLPDHAAELIGKIENGFVVDDTGELARFPRLARTHLKTSVRLGGLE